MLNNVIDATCIGTLLKENNVSEKSRCSINDATELEPGTTQFKTNTQPKLNQMRDRELS